MGHWGGILCHFYTFRQLSPLWLTESRPVFLRVAYKRPSTCTLLMAPISFSKLHFIYSFTYFVFVTFHQETEYTSEAPVALYRIAIRAWFSYHIEMAVTLKRYCSKATLYKLESYSIIRSRMA